MTAADRHFASLHSGLCLHFDKRADRINVRRGLRERNRKPVPRRLGGIPIHFQRRTAVHQSDVEQAIIVQINNDRPTTAL